jgi:glycosyltransferase involved in cell wall biosynthesis
MRLVFLDNNLQYDGSTLLKQPLGGSETALIRMAAEMARRGHEVRVYNRCAAPGTHDGVEYRRFDDYGETAYLPADVTIALRNAVLLGGFTNSTATVLWMQDAFNQPILKPLGDPRCKALIDRLFFVSKWQAWSFLRCNDWPKDRIWITRNGVWLNNYTINPALASRGKRLCYTSTPFRGLHLLLQLFPRILKEVPDAELHVHSSMGVYQVPESQDLKEYGGLYKLMEQPGVRNHGSIAQHELANKMLTYRVFAYPNTFHETGCIAAVEAMASGCAVVTGAQGALPEILDSHGTCIPGVPGGAVYNDTFVERCAAYLRDDLLWQRDSDALHERAHKLFGWSLIAQEWEGQLAQLIKEKQA